MKIYKIFLDERHIALSKNASQWEFRELDNVGFVLEYNNEQKIKGEITDDFIRRHLACIYRVDCLIEAKDLEEAFSKCKEIHKVGLKMGLNKPAQVIIYDHYFIYPECPIRNKNCDGEFVCGKETHSISKSGEFGMCFIEGFENCIEDSCPLIFNCEKETFELDNEKADQLKKIYC